LFCFKTLPVVPALIICLGLPAVSGAEQNPRASYDKLGKEYYGKGDFPNAIRHLKQALESKPDDLESAQLLALCYFATGQMRLAVPLLENMQGRDVTAQVDASHLLAVGYIKTGEWEKARRAISRMYSVPAESATARLLFSRMLVKEGLEDRAIPELQQSIASDPRLPMVRFLLGEIYLHKNEPGLALAEFRKELEINPTVWLVYWRLGDALARQQKYNEAEAALKQAIWLNETFSGPYVLLGQIELKKGDSELAIGFLERAARMDPQNYQAHYSLARALQGVGRTDEANREFSTARSLLSGRGDRSLTSSSSLGDE
jgi:tetratricopeptide (TPR) repeat protein